MKLLSVNAARALWFFNANDINPRGKDIGDGYLKLSERYSFTKVPTHLERLESMRKNEGVEFLGGSFKTSNGETIGVNLTLYAQGMVADSRSSTADSDEFLSDFLHWIPDNIGVPVPDRIPRNKRYLSEVFVSFDEPLIGLNPKLSKLCKLLQFDDAASKTFEFSALAFAVDPSANPNPQLPNFRIERAEGTPFSEGRYWSHGPITTDKHLEILEAFEALLRG